MTGPQIIVLATPVFLALIGVELAIGRARGRAGYRLNDALSSIGLGVMSQVAGVFTAVLTLGIYVAVHERFAVWQLSPTSPWTWVDRPGRLRLPLLLAPPRRPPRRPVLGRARRPSPERGLQPVDRAAPDLERLAGRLDLLPADGDRRLSAARLRGRRADRPALSVLGPHRAGRPPRRVRPLVLRAEQPPRPPRRQRRLPRPQLRRRVPGLGSPLRHLRRRGSGACRASTARARRSGAGTRSAPTCRSTPSSAAIRGARRAGSTSCASG